VATRVDDIKIHVSADDKASRKLTGLKKQVLAIGAAYLSWRVAKDVIGEIITKTAEYEQSLVSLRSVAAATGRDINEVYAEIETHLGKMATRATITKAMLSGLVTELNVKQISELTRAVRNASLAFGKDLNTQIDLTMRAIASLQPMVLKSIGINIDMTEVNKRIAEGYYGMGTAINAATQQHAMYVETVQQAQKFANVEQQLLGTTTGLWRQFNRAIEDARVEVGTGLLPALKSIAPAVLGMVAALGTYGTAVSGMLEAVWSAGSTYVGGVKQSAASLTVIVKTVKAAFDVLVDSVIEQAQKIGRVADRIGDMLAAIADRDVQALKMALAGLSVDIGVAMAPPDTSKLEQAVHDVIAAIDEAQVLARARAGDMADALQGVVSTSLNNLQTMVTSFWAEYAKIQQQIRDSAITPDVMVPPPSEGERDLAEWQEMWDTYLQHIHDGTEAIYKHHVDVVHDMTEDMDRAFGSFVGSAASHLATMRGNAADTFKNIAADFKRFFVQVVLMYLAPGSAFATGFVNSFRFFDRRTNDLMLIHEGEKAAGFIAEGFMKGIQGLGSQVTGAIAGAGVGAGTVNVYNMGGGYGRTDRLISDIEFQADYGVTRINTNDARLTGGGYVNRR